MSWNHLDEDSVRSRPPRRTRPRSTNRPAHADAITAVVVAVDRGRFTCAVDSSTVQAVRSGELRRTQVVVGDRVGVVGDVSGRTDSLARIIRVDERTTVLRRTADDIDPVERVVVANAEQLVVVLALANPEPRMRFVDRCLVAAFEGGLEPLLCLTKHDLSAPVDLLRHYASLGVRAVSTSSKVAGDPGVDELRALLHDRTSVLVGQSGVGKSTLVNLLVPDASRRVGELTGAGKGRHTSTSAVALQLPGGGWIIDTPGLRSFGLAHVTPDRLLKAFPDLEPGLDGCPRGCTHTAVDDDECGLAALVAAGAAKAERLDSFRRLLAAKEGDPDTGT